MITRQQQLILKLIEDIISKNDAKKKKKDYQISKNSSKLLGNYLAIITQLLEISINEIMMLLCQTMSLRVNIVKVVAKYKEFYHKIITIMN